MSVLLASTMPTSRPVSVTFTPACAAQGSSSHPKPCQYCSAASRPASTRTLSDGLSLPKPAKSRPVSGLSMRSLSSRSIASIFGSRRSDADAASTASQKSLYSELPLRRRMALILNVAARTS